MNRNEMRRFHAKTKKLTDFDKLLVARHWCSQSWTGPLDEHETAISNQVVQRHDSSNWFHGGLSGFSVGDELLPAKHTGKDPRGLGRSILDRFEHVYMSHDPRVSRRFAEECDGSQYQIEPVGQIIVDPMDVRAFRLVTSAKNFKQEARSLSLETVVDMFAEFFLNFACPRAKILEVL